MQNSSAAPFEGIEKRLTLTYNLSHPFFPSGFSLHEISRVDLDRITDLCRCKICSEVRSPLGYENHTPHGRPHGYLLSESTLMIWKDTIEIKTCGTTAPLLAIPAFHEVLAKHIWGFGGGNRLQPQVSDLIASVKFSRMSFLFPEQQSWPHRSWGEELQFLSQYFVGGKQVVMPGVSDRDFHFYHWESPIENEKPSSQLSLTEFILTGIREDCQTRFLEDNNSVRKTGCVMEQIVEQIELASSREHNSGSSAVDGEKGKSAIDERFFEPYGYSCNGVIGKFGECFDVHISPEAEVAYASIEISLPADRLLGPECNILDLLKKAFEPKSISVVGFTPKSGKLSTKIEKFDKEVTVDIDGLEICHLSTRNNTSPRNASGHNAYYYHFFQDGKASADCGSGGDLVDSADGSTDVSSSSPLCSATDLAELDVVFRASV